MDSIISYMGTSSKDSATVLPLTPGLYDHAVGSEIRKRLSGHPTPGTKLALAIEGGGMRGVITSGACAALESYGLGPDIFDEVFGSSAGSVVAAFYLASQIRLGTPVFYEDITSREFIDFRRVFTGQAIMDLNFLVRNVIIERKPLDFARAIRGRKLRTVATNLAQARRQVFPPPKSREQLQDFLQASASIPLIARTPYVVDGRPYVDASVSEAIPWQAAIDEGATHVLVLSSRPLGHSKGASAANAVTQWLWTRRYSPAVKRLAAARITTSVERARMLETMTTKGDAQPAHVYAICPGATEAPVSQLTQDCAVLLEGCKQGFRAVSAALRQPDPTEFRVRGYFDRADNTSS